jgi:hypothetical protein
MASTTATNVLQAIAYAASELGEKVTIANDGTVSSVKAFDNKTVVMPALTSQATAKLHVLSVHPKIGSIVG